MPGRGRYSAEFQITADTGGLRRGFSDATRQQQRFLAVSRDGWRQFGRLAAVGTAAATASLAGLATAGLRAAGEIRTLQRQTNLSAEQASRWRLALRAAGGEVSDVEDLLRTLNSRVIEFARGESTAVDAFRALGASVSDFDLSNPSQQLSAFLRLLEQAPHSQAQFAADELVGDMARVALQMAEARRSTELLQRAFGPTLADSGQIADRWGVISGFAAAASESIGVAFLRGLTSGVGSSEELADVLYEDVLPAVRAISSVVEGIGRGLAAAARGVAFIAEGFESNPVTGAMLDALRGERSQPPSPGGSSPSPLQPNRLPELVVTGRGATRTTPLHARTQAISDRAIEGERIEAARRRFLLASIQPGPQDDPRNRLAQAVPDFAARAAQQQELAQQAWWREFWQNTGRSLQQGLTQSIGGAVASFVSGRDAGSLRALGDNLLQSLSSTIARVFAQAVVDATVGQVLGGLSSAFAGAGAGGGAAPITGFYNTGGVVPGPVGRPEVAVVHGGEAIFTPEQLRVLGDAGGGDTYVFNLADVSRQSEDAVNGMLDRIVAAVSRDRYERGLPA